MKKFILTVVVISGFLSADSFYSDSYAVIIGINDYEKVNQLNYALADAEAIKSLLVSKFNFPESNISLITDKEATLKNIKNTLYEVSTSTKKNDRLLVFFAGHGETIELSEGGEIGYLVPVDGDYDNLYTSSISMNEIKQISSIANAKHVLFLVDACYGGLMVVDSRGLDRKTEGYMGKITKDKARQIITAGGKGERVVEKAEWGHSAFTKNIITGLDEGLADIDNDGYITANELGTFLKKRVSIDSQNLQTPQERRLTSDEGEFVFVYAENTAVIQDKSTDEKLDYLISEMEELKSEKSGGDDIVGKKAVDGKKSWQEKYGYEGYSIGFTVLEDFFSIGGGKSLNKKWNFSLGYSHGGNRTMKKLISVHENHSLAFDMYGIMLTRSYEFQDIIGTGISIGVGYFSMNWQDTEQNTSGNFKKILYQSSVGAMVIPIHIEQPFPMTAGISFGITISYYPISYEIDEDGIVNVNDWRIKFLPGFTFSFSFPENKP